MQQLITILFDHFSFLFCFKPFLAVVVAINQCDCKISWIRVQSAHIIGLPLEVKFLVFLIYYILNVIRAQADISVLQQ